MSVLNRKWFRHPYLENMDSRWHMESPRTITKKRLEEDNICLMQRVEELEKLCCKQHLEIRKLENDAINHDKILEGQRKIIEGLTNRFETMGVKVNTSYQRERFQERLPDDDGYLIDCKIKIVDIPAFKWAVRDYSCKPAPNFYGGENAPKPLYKGEEDE